jgi:HD-like signal output (HDOD) protein
MHAPTQIPRRSHAMNATLTKPDSSQIIAKAIGSLGDLATLPEVTVRIIQIVENPRSTARDLHDVIKNDAALSSRILKVVNSAFYGLPGQIASIDRAIVLLGLSAVKNVAIAASMSNMFNGKQAIQGFNGMAAWKHSLAVGVGCRLLSRAQGKPAVEESFLAGLIHDLGLLVERQAFSAQLGGVIARHAKGGGDFCAIEQEIIGADHQAFGMALATKWRFPATLCTAIGYHHKPAELAAAHRELPILVHIADVIACKAGIGFSQTAAGETIDPSLVEAVGLTPAKIDEVAAALAEHVAQAEALFSA